MTGSRRAAPSTPSTPTHLPNATTPADQKQSGGHSPTKFMSELRSIHSKLIIKCNTQTQEIFIYRAKSWYTLQNLVRDEVEDT